jgi:hypothetical protein
MAKHKSDVPDKGGKNETPKARGGAMAEDRSKSLTPGQSDGPFAEQKERKAPTEKKTSGEQKR